MDGGTRGVTRPLQGHSAVLQDVDRTEWGRFFESFTMLHDQWLVSVDDEKDSLPLEGIVARDGRIDIRLGADVRHHRKIVIDADRVSIQQSGGAEETLAIVSTGGQITRLRFRSPVPPPSADERR